jgi:hypothetical protein
VSAWWKDNQHPLSRTERLLANLVGFIVCAVIAAEMLYVCGVVTGVIR